jgi:hypothetical protein
MPHICLEPYKQTFKCDDCGSEGPSFPNGMTSAYSITHNPDGSELLRCPACAHKHDIAEFEKCGDEGKPFYGYFDEDHNLIGLRGNILARNVHAFPCKLARHSFMHHGRPYKSVHVIDPQGRIWYGRGSAGICCTMRMNKARK